MTGLIVVPGIENSGDTHWQTAWERTMADTVRIAPASWDEPELGDWIAAIDTAVSVRGSDSIVVAHSLGCLATVAWLARHPNGVRGAMLVAPPNPEGSAFPAAASSFAGTDYGSLRLRVPTLVVASDDDPYGGTGIARRFSEAWGSTLIEVGSLGHINEASALGDWPQGRELLHDFETGLASPHL